MKIVLLLLVGLQLASALDKSCSVESLNDDWTMVVIDGPIEAKGVLGKSFATSVPTTLHLDLLANQQISDPFFADNYPKMKWISGCRVKYLKRFSINK